MSEVKRWGRGKEEESGGKAWARMGGSGRDKREGKGEEVRDSKE